MTFMFETFFFADIYKCCVELHCLFIVTSDPEVPKMFCNDAQSSDYSGNFK